jgi:hypothetical protein
VTEPVSPFASMCAACGASGQPCCDTGCDPGLGCANRGTRCEPCGGSQQVCCPNAACQTGLTCVANPIDARCQP